MSTNTILPDYKPGAPNSSTVSTTFVSVCNILKLFIEKTIRNDCRAIKIHQYELRNISYQSIDLDSMVAHLIVKSTFGQAIVFVISKMCASRIRTRVCPLRVRRFVHWATASRPIDFMLCSVFMSPW